MLFRSAARERGNAEALETASEALSTDNEALAASEPAVHDPKKRYRTTRQRSR